MGSTKQEIRNEIVDEEIHSSPGEQHSCAVPAHSSMTAYSHCNDKMTLALLEMFTVTLVLLCQLQDNEWSQFLGYIN